MDYADIIGMQQLDIIGRGMNGGAGAFAQNQLAGPRYAQPQQYCPPQQMAPPPSSGAGGFYGPGGGFSPAALAAGGLGFGALPGFAQRSGGLSYGWPAMWPGADPAAAAQLQAAYGDCVFPPWPSCFGPPPNPFLVQKTLEPAVWVEPRCPTDIETQLVGLPEECIGPCERVRIQCDVCVLTKFVRLVICSDIAFQLVFDDIRVCKDSIVNCGPVPACMFVEDATDAFHVDWPTIQPGGNIEFLVRNISDAEVCFRGGAWARMLIP